MGLWVSQTNSYRVREETHRVCCGVQTDDVKLMIVVCMKVISSWTKSFGKLPSVSVALVR